MNNRRLHRPVALLERHSLWIFTGVAAAAAIAAAIFIISLGAFPAFGSLWWGRTLRGYTAPGILLGIASLVFFALTFAYSLRKRAWQETAPWLLRTTMAAWLWSHVYFGLLALVFVFFHAGSGLFTSGLSTGLIALILMALLILSGIVWRLIYGYVPALATAQVGNYSQSESRDQGQNDLIEIEKLSAGKSAEFHRLKEAILAGKKITTVGSLDAAEHADFEAVRGLAARRQHALRRLKLQAAFDSVLQIWKIAHIPLVVITLIAIAAHVIAVFDIPAQAAPLQTGGFHPAKECSECHETIYQQWSQSMHAHAVTSPVTVAQVNQVMTTTFADAARPDPYLFCNNCHSPVGVRLTGQATLPMQPASPAAAELAAEGVSCTACHQFNGESRSGQGGLKPFNRDLRPGRVFFGAIADSVGNPNHQSQASKVAAQPDKLCQNCHNVNYDSNGDGQIIKGADLILQSIYTEWERYVAAGGTKSCMSCHLPVVESAARIAEKASIPGQQDYEAPKRVLHDHSFVGVDYPLDQPEQQRQARTALLQQSAILTIDPASIQIAADGQLHFNVSLTNSGVGHNLPGGFAFARQMWLEVIVRDQGGGRLFQSGVLASNTADLCDSATMDDAGDPLNQYLQGCPTSDPQLVNFQQKLVDQIAQAVNANGKVALDGHGDPIPIQPKAGEETWLQTLTGGVVSRVRPSDGQELDPIEPGGTRTFEFRVPGVAAKMVILQVRLLFRNQPPYLLRAIAAHQLPDDPMRLEPLIGNLQIMEMTAATRIFTWP